MKMRAKSSSPKSKNEGLEIGKIEKQKERHLSSVYIRSLVKQLASSKTKKSSSCCENGSQEMEHISTNQNLTGYSWDELTDHHKQVNSEQSPQRHKKQVRRRLHNTRPYQQKLLNMAEVRKEIVTALKTHRASMKQCSENQPLESSSHRILLEKKSRRNSRTYPSTSCNPSFSANSLERFSFSQSWPITPIIPPPLFYQENFSFSLPIQTLGLNLNIEDFEKMSNSTFQYNINSPVMYSSSSFPNTSSLSETSCVVGQVPVVDSCGFGWRPDDEKADDYDVDYPFDEEVKFPAWLSVNNESFLDDHCSDYYVQDPSLSCMDIEEIEGVDGDWLV